MSLSRSALVMVMCLAGPARANPLEVFGLTSRRSGQANTGIASADDASALYYDPAGIVGDGHAQLSIGALGAYAHLAIGPAHPPLPHPYSMQLALRAPIGNRFAVGFALHASPRLARLVVREPDRAFYPYYADRSARVVALPGIAAQLGNGFSVGAALDTLPGITAGETRADAIGRAILGLRWAASPAVRLGAVYRQRAHLPFTVGQRRAVGQYTPHELGAGVAWTTDTVVAAIDVQWAHWARYPGPYALDAAPRVPFDDTFAARLGVESTSTDGALFHGGYGFESSAVPTTQTGVTNLLDGNKHTVSGGAGYIWPRAAAGNTVRVDAHVQIQVVGTRTLEKTVWDGAGEYDPYTSIVDENNPGYPSLKSGGEVISGGLTLGIDL